MNSVSKIFRKPSRNILRKVKNINGLKTADAFSSSTNRNHILRVCLGLEKRSRSHFQKVKIFQTLSRRAFGKLEALPPVIQTTFETLFKSQK